MNRVGKIVAMLSSDNDNTVLTAVRTLGRVLKSQGKDWNWFAEQIDKATSVPEPAPKRGYDAFRQRYATERKTHGPFGNPVEDDRVTDIDMSKTEELHDSGKLRGGELNFIEELYYRISIYNKKAFITAGQRKYLNDLHQRIFH